MPTYSYKCNKCGKEIMFDNRENRCMRINPEEYYPEIIMKNNHPTCKSLLLNKSVLDLFKTPNRENETILIPFSGVFSEVIGAIASGFKEENLTAFELTNSEDHPYIDIGQARYKFWKENNFFFQIKDKKEYAKKKKEADKKNDTKKEIIEENKLF